ncbi:hypothetical protein EC973_001681 [Apophysomyces ossiformis]|uniref:Phosphoglycerate mutase n=1 Tax=Apophysomyces ossiformis TaxID=679940 RepID=A0A8H7BLP6_9FUNG|nr:hypothetical protein EC973_001681 [Apophysomyces ossiformis]
MYNHLPNPLKNRYIIARHGFSLANNAKLICSNPEIAIPEEGGPQGTGWGLHDRGKEQVKESALRLSQHLFPNQKAAEDRVRMFCSPFVRTRQTAEIIRSVLNETAQANIDSVTPNLALRERWYAEFDMTNDENYKVCWKDDEGPDHGENSPYGIEAPSSVADRTTRFIRDIEEQVEGKIVILVAHGDVCQIMQTAFYGWEAWQHRQMEHVDTANWRDMKANLN